MELDLGYTTRIIRKDPEDLGDLPFSIRSGPLYGAQRRSRQNAAAYARCVCPPAGSETEGRCGHLKAVCGGAL